jgi:hypothetical protein
VCGSSSNLRVKYQNLFGFLLLLLLLQVRAKSVNYWTFLKVAFSEQQCIDFTGQLDTLNM